MAKYLIEETLAAKGVAGVLENPEDRTEPVRRVFEAAGCKLEQFYASLIDNKTYLIVEAPDLESVKTVTVHFEAAGAAVSIKCSPIITAAQAAGLFKRAAGVAYRPPGR